MSIPAEVLDPPSTSPAPVDSGPAVKAPASAPRPGAPADALVLPGWHRRFRITYIVAAAVLLGAYVALALLDTQPMVLREVTYQLPEVLAFGACLLRGVLVRYRRGAWLTLAFGIGAWIISDLIFVLVLEPSGSIPYPSVGDGLYLTFYLACFTALALLARGRRLGVGFSLDAAIGVLAIATVWAAVLPESVFDTSGSTAAVATNMLYPLFDVLLIALVTVAATSNRWRLGWAMGLFASALVLLAVADTIYLVRVAKDTYAAGTVSDILWPAAMACVGLAAWAPTAVAPSRRPVAEYVFPVACALLALVLLVWDHFYRADLTTVLLAAAVILASTLRGARLHAAREQEGRRTEETLRRTVRALALTVDAKDAYTANHSQRVTMYALAIGVEIALDPGTLKRLATAGELHDLGKLAIPDSVLLKPGRLSANEFAIMKGHSAAGERIVARAGMPDVARVVRHHHERYDGRGYPDAIAGEQIPLESRILAVADSLDAMTSDRAYSRSKTTPQARAELERNVGSQFDPKLAAVAIALIDRGVMRPGDHPPVDAALLVRGREDEAWAQQLEVAVDPGHAPLA